MNRGLQHVDHPLHVGFIEQDDVIDAPESRDQRHSFALIQNRPARIFDRTNRTIAVDGDNQNISELACRLRGIERGRREVCRSIRWPERLSGLSAARLILQGDAVSSWQSVHGLDQFFEENRPGAVFHHNYSARRNSLIRAASQNSPPAASASVNVAITVSPAPVTSATSSVP